MSEMSAEMRAWLEELAQYHDAAVTLLRAKVDAKRHTRPFKGWESFHAEEIGLFERDIERHEEAARRLRGNGPPPPSLPKSVGLAIAEAWPSLNDAVSRLLAYMAVMKPSVAAGQCREANGALVAMREAVAKHTAQSEAERVAHDSMARLRAIAADLETVPAEMREVERVARERALVRAGRGPILIAIDPELGDRVRWLTDAECDEIRGGVR